MQNELYEFHKPHAGNDWSLNWWDAREKAVRTWSWAVPNDAALAAITAHGPVLEVGAGGGYWAALLEQRGCRVVATDETPWENTFTDVGALEATEAVKLYGRTRNLLTVWPPLDSTMAANALATFKSVNPTGNVFYVGEGDGGCTGCDIFHNLLNTHYDLDDEVEIPTWPGIHDRLFIYSPK